MKTLRIWAFVLVWLWGCVAPGGVPGAKSPLSSPAASPRPTATAAAQGAPSEHPAAPMSPTLPPTATATVAPPPQVLASPQVRFAVIGDYGTGGGGEVAVARLVRGWHPDFIVTTGDNNLPAGDPADLDAHVGQFFGDFIREGRFFPALGNHDWDAGDLTGYLAYFHPPGNGRYYEFAVGPVHLFVLDSDPREPDGITVDSPQAQWLRARLPLAQEPWRLVVLHHSPYSSGFHGSTEALQWPYARWGAAAVIGGHDHTYERVLRDGIVYLVNGLGGNGRYEFPHPVEGSQVRYNALYGALWVEATPGQITFQFFNIKGERIDTYTLLRP